MGQSLCSFQLLPCGLLPDTSEAFVHSKTGLTVSDSHLSKSNSSMFTWCSVPWNDDSILVVLKLEGEGVLLGVLSGRNASAGLRLLNVLHKLKVHI